VCLPAILTEVMGRENGLVKIKGQKGRVRSLVPGLGDLSTGDSAGMLWKMGHSCR
jgi:hypothetical protein